MFTLFRCTSRQLLTTLGAIMEDICNVKKTQCLKVEKAAEFKMTLSELSCVIDVVGSC